MTKNRIGEGPGTLATVKSSPGVSVVRFAERLITENLMKKDFPGLFLKIHI